MEKLPSSMLDDLKWLVWNEIWCNVNQKEVPLKNKRIAKEDKVMWALTDILPRMRGGGGAHAHSHHALVLPFSPGTKYGSNNFIYR